MLDPDIYEQELMEGRGRPIPGYVSIVQEARYWNVSPMEIMEWPMEWVRKGQIVREAEALAQRRMTEKYKR